MTAFKDGYGGEALVVDDKKFLQLKVEYQNVLGMAKEYSRENKLHMNQVAMGTIFNYVSRRMPYDMAIADEQLKRVGHGGKISLTAYIDRGGGVCRHQALFGGYLIEKMIDDGYLRGKVSVDRSYSKEEGGHAWIRYTNSVGKVFILDIAQGVMGALEKVNTNSYWDYRRPEERGGLASLKKKLVLK